MIVVAQAQGATKVSQEVAADSKEWRREGGSNCDIPLCGTVRGRKRDCRVGRSRSRDGVGIENDFGHQVIAS